MIGWNLKREKKSFCSNQTDKSLNNSCVWVSSLHKTGRDNCLEKAERIV